ncbi:MAG: DUF1361 domain-containing protein [Bacteroidota bacterium]|nr:DUF1361 domain-containing protein [Bacteroidota bacterium]
MFTFCLALLVIRIVRTEQFSYVFLTWNLFLAFIPYLLIKKFKAKQNRFVQISLVAGTILFLPNAPYILTDLFHLRERIAAPMWFDLILILSFAFLGMVFFVLSVNKLLSIFNTLFASRLITSALKFLIMLSSSYGIYLGRYLRLNSWDVISSPIYLVRKMFFSVFDGNCNKETFSVTITFTIFLYLVFEIVASLKEATNTQQNELS